MTTALMDGAVPTHRLGERAVKAIRFHSLPCVIPQFRPRGALRKYVMAEALRRVPAVGLLRNLEHQFPRLLLLHRRRCYMSVANDVHLLPAAVAPEG